MKKETKNILIKLAISCVLIGALVLVVFLMISKNPLFNQLKSVEDLKKLILSSGNNTIFLFIAICFLQVTFIPLPSTITTTVGGLLFGPFLGGMYSYIGIMLGSIFAFGIGKIFGYPLVKWIIGQELLDKYMLKVKGKDKVIFFFMFLFPIFPDDALCLIAALTPMKWTFFIAMNALTRPIGIFTTTYFVEGLTNFGPFQIVLLIIVGAATAVGFVYTWKNSEKIEKFFVKVFHKNKE